MLDVPVKNDSIYDVLEGQHGPLDFEWDYSEL